MKINPMVVVREDFEDAAVAFNSNNGEIRSLNKTALFIWKEVEAGADVKQILAHLKDACGDSMPDNAEEDVLAFLDLMKQRGFMQD